MVRPLSNDLRKRVVAAVSKGESCRAVALRWGFGCVGGEVVAALPFDGLCCARQDGRSPQAGA